MLALAVFVASGVLAWRQLPEINSPHWGVLLAVALIGVPANVALNAAEYAATALIAGYRVPPGRALEIKIGRASCRERV